MKLHQLFLKVCQYTDLMMSSAVKMHHIIHPLKGDAFDKPLLRLAISGARLAKEHKII